MENDDVTVLLVWNGPGVGQKWQLQSVLRALKRQRGEESEDEEDSVKEIPKKVRAIGNGGGGGGGVSGASRIVVKAEKNKK